MTHPVHLRARVLLALILCAASFGFGCGSSLQVTRINSSERKPNNVWIFFTVQRGQEPVGGLAADDFQIYEDDERVSPYESRQVIQNPDVAAVMYTMLLLDMSGSVTGSGEVNALVDAAKLFTQRVGKSQKVGVYTFDGSKDIAPVVSFTEAPERVDAALERLRGHAPRDPSTNLHGAITSGLDELRRSLDKDPRPLKFGTLVVFTDGTDRAGRVTREQMQEQLDSEHYKHYQLFAVGVGAEINPNELSQIGRDGTELAAEPQKVRDSFETIAARIEAHMKRFYLLSYCTPARHGNHRVRIEVDREDVGAGYLEYDFNADAFGPPPDCDPERKPDFRLDDLGQFDNPELGDTGRRGPPSVPRGKSK